MNFTDQNEDAEILMSLSNGAIVWSDLDISSLDIFSGKERIILNHVISRHQ